MMGASIETTLELWASSLRDVKARIRPLFTQERVAASAGLFLDGLLGDERRKTGWMRAEAAGDPGPWRQQAILGRGRWDADALRDIVRDYVVETWPTEMRFWSSMRPGFSSRARRPAAWRANTRALPARSRTARSACSPPMSRAMAMPSSTGRCICPKPGRTTRRGWRRRMCRDARASRPSPPCSCDDRARDCGRRAVRLGCGRQRLWRRRYRNGVAARRQGLRARRQSQPSASVPGRQAAGRRDGEEIAERLAASAMAAPVGGRRNQRRSGCTTGPIANWPISTPPNTTTRRTGLWTRGLLIRRNIADGDLAFFSTWCPAGTGIETLVKVEGHRWAIEDSFETAKNELGLDHNETRSWHGWHRHVSLVMLAFAMMAAIRHRANAAPPPKTNAKTTRQQAPPLIRWSVQEIRRIAIRLARRASTRHTSSHGQSGEGHIKPQLEKLISKRKCNCNASAICRIDWTETTVEWKIARFRSLELEHENVNLFDDSWSSDCRCSL